MVVIFAMAVAVGVIGIIGWNIDFMFGMLPTLLIAVGVADSVHVLTELDIYQRKLGNRREAIRRTLYLVGPPCLLTSLTTAAGFLSLSFSPLKSIAHLAVYISAGVMAAFLATITILVACVYFGREPSPEELAKKKDARQPSAICSGVPPAFDRELRHSISKRRAPRVGGRLHCVRRGDLDADGGLEFPHGVLGRNSGP